MADYKIQFCENNFSFGTDKIIEMLENEIDDDIEIEVVSCLGFCDDCSTSPFALINGEIVQADTPEDLFEEIKSYIL
ncbi:DUF1450 domain-containing protein [Caloranaerobacter ferrireducens]|uniref:DUF1450 domain-containing protein n=1 Tax=Caloranaerobacter ferrireducens TaxID=1323370 RepID=UPI00084DFE36|nr:DUF1450 domain-containing protein [Caloranaerobacter ferrireducens]